MCREEAGGAVSFSVSQVGGTHAYMAPERLQTKSNRPTVASDMFSVGVVLLLSFSPKNIEQLEGREGTPKQIFTMVKGHFATDLIATLENLLSNNPRDRPSARKILDENGFFARAAADVPSWWIEHGHTPGSGCAVPVSDPETLTRLESLIQPTRPDEFGLGFDQGVGWTQMGFNAQPTSRLANQGLCVSPRAVVIKCLVGLRRCSSCKHGAYRTSGYGSVTTRVSAELLIAYHEVLLCIVKICLI